MRRLVPIGRVPTARTRVPYVVATVGDDLRLGQVSGHHDPCARVGSVRTGTEHRVALLAQWFGPELCDQRLLEATRSPRYSLRNYPLSPEAHACLCLQVVLQCGRNVTEQIRVRIRVA